MKVLLIVQREPGTDGGAWVEDAIDEHTLDEWNGAMPTCIQEKVSASPADFRELWVALPDGCLDRLWDVPTVIGEP